MGKSGPGRSFQAKHVADCGWWGRQGQQSEKRWVVSQLRPSAPPGLPDTPVSTSPPQL